MTPWVLGEICVLRHAGFPFDWLEELGVAPAAMAALDAHLDAPEDPVLRATAEAAYASERARLGERLRERARDERVQEAVFLSSPDMFENVWARYVEAPPGANTSASRRIERQVYAYLQRLCAKNETTSFFGPVGYGETAGDDDAIELLPATPRRRTWLAYWAVEELASRAALEPELWRELPIRRNPLFAIDPVARVARCESIAAQVPLDDAQLRLLAAIETLESADELATRLELSRAALEELAMSLFQRGVLVRRLWFRSDEADVLGRLRDALAALPGGPARTRWLDALARLDALRARFETAALADRRALLPRMEALFAELTGASPRRAGGRLYTDRLIVNEEASSPFRLRIGAEAARGLAAALSPLLDVAARAGLAFQRTCAARATAALGAGTVGFLAYASALRELHVPVPALALDADARPVIQLPEALRDRGDDDRRFALPDVCLGRAGSGPLHVVLARMHHHLLTPGWMFSLYPDPARVARLSAPWLRGEAVPLVELATGRHNKGYYAFPGPRAAHATAELGERGHPVFAIADLRVELDGDGPTLHAPDGAPLRLYLPLSDLTLHAPFAALSHPPVIKAPVAAAGAHTPRLDVGDATYQRETWNLQLDGCAKLSGFALFARLQAERRRAGLPRFGFARVPSERKPFLVDLDCPFAVELLRHHARTGAVQVEEMLPAPAELWLRDARGRYTFELRMQATR